MIHIIGSKTVGLVAGMTGQFFTLRAEINLFVWIEREVRGGEGTWLGNWSLPGMDETARDGLTRQQFARYYLMRLGIGHDLTRIALDPKHPRKLATEAELLALRPELQHIE